MFVAHDTVKAHLIGEGVLLMGLIVQHVGLFRIEMAVEKAETPGVILRDVFTRDVAVGLLNEPEDLHPVLGAS